MEDKEEMPFFDAGHYPKGVNADFYNVENVASDKMLSHYKSRLEDPENRDIAKNKEKIIEMLKEVCHLSKGQTVVDFGSGTGILVNDIVSIIKDEEKKSGKLVATEISNVFVDHLNNLAKENSIQDYVEVIYNKDARDPNLDKYNGTVDLIIVIDVYHHIEFPKTVLKKLHKALKKGGKLLILDFIRDATIHKSHAGDWVMKHVRAGQEVFREEVLSCDFKLVVEPPVPFLAENYVMIFEHKD